MPAPTAPYDSLEDVVNAARMRLNDMIASVGGDVLVDTAPFTIVAVNAAWRKLQEFLSKLGFLRFKNECILQLRALGHSDETERPYLDWTGFHTTGFTDDTIVLPQDLIAPIELRERSLEDVSRSFQAMDFLPGGLPLIGQGYWLKTWSWHDEKLWIPGNIGITGVQVWIRYWSFAPDFVAAGTTAFASQQVPIMRCLNPFSLYLAAEIAAPRGDATAQSLITDAEAEATIMVSRENPSVLLPAQPAQAGA